MKISDHRTMMACNSFVVSLSSAWIIFRCVSPTYEVRFLADLVAFVCPLALTGTIKPALPYSLNQVQTVESERIDRE